MEISVSVVWVLLYWGCRHAPCIISLITINKRWHDYQWSDSKENVEIKVWKYLIRTFSHQWKTLNKKTNRNEGGKKEKGKQKKKKKDVTESRNPHSEFNYIFFVNHRKASAGTACHIVKIARVSGMLYTNVLFSDSWRDLRLFLDQPVTPWLKALCDC